MCTLNRSVISIVSQSLMLYFLYLEQLRMLIDEWINAYNNRKTQESLRKLTPNKWQMEQLKPELSTFNL